MNFSQPIVLVTETAILKVANDLWLQWILLRFQCLFFWICPQHMTLLTMTYYFTEHTFGFQGTAHAWLRSYLSSRTQTVSIGGRLSSPTVIHCGVPQGGTLFLGQFFSSYTLNLDDMQQTSNEPWQNVSSTDSPTMHKYVSILTFIHVYKWHSYWI